MPGFGGEKLLNWEKQKAKGFENGSEIWPKFGPRKIPEYPSFLHSYSEDSDQTV